MKVRWAPAAYDDLASIYKRIRADSRQSAQRVVSRIHNEAESLALFPHRGRAGRVGNTRELVIAPYIVIYRVLQDAIEIAAVIHGAQRWPKI